MLHSIRLRNFRCYADTQTVEFKKLNLFIGANNAGKTSFVSAIELLLASATGRNAYDALNFSGIPAFSSFDSMLRRHWNRSEARPTQIYFDVTFVEPDTKDSELKCSYTCIGTKDDSPQISQLSVANQSHSLKLDRKPGQRSGELPIYTLAAKTAGAADVNAHFMGIVPYIVPRGDEKTVDHELNYQLYDSARDRDRSLEVIRPYRPVPRSYYVLDDPSLQNEDKKIISYLVQIWDSESDRLVAIRKRIEESLVALQLASKIKVVKASKRTGPKVVEIRIAPALARQSVTLADAGFGVSQVLPLLAYDARLAEGYCVAYQPEVHLHPFAQSRLADIFVNSIKRGNQVFVETHSTDMILRLQAKIASGEIKPDDVRVFCFENKKGQSLIKQVDLGEGGSPSIPWPKGFLDTSVNLAKDIFQIRRPAQR